MNVTRLGTGVSYYSRVSAGSDRGFGPSVARTSDPSTTPASGQSKVGEGSEDVGGAPIAPYGPPGNLPAVSLEHVDASHLRLTFKQAAATNGAAVASYDIAWGLSAGNGEQHVTTLVPDYNVQMIEAAVWEGGFESEAKFTLTLGDFRGAFTAPLGNYDANNFRTLVSIQDGTNNLTRVAPNATNGAGSAELYKSIPRGAFLQVGGQEFRVCLSTVVDEVGAFDAAHLPLCRVDAPFEPAFYHGRGYASVLERVPAFVLDTNAGSAMDLGVGDSFLQTFFGPFEALEVNNLTSVLQRGDYIRIGHPTEGRTFRVSTDTSRDFNASHLPLGDVNDASVEVSVLVGDIVSATYEKQVLHFFGDPKDLNKTSGVGGYRLLFGNERTETTNAGGVMRSKRGPANDWGRGCLVWDGSAAALEEELETLVGIDDVAVTREMDASGGNVTYTITFHGALVRGDVPQLTITDVGTDGCEPFLNATSYVKTYSQENPVAYKDYTLEPSFLPLYKVQTTAELGYDATAADVKAAVETLTAACTVDVSRELVGTGYTWAVTFGQTPFGRPLEAIFTNAYEFTGAVQMPTLRVYALSTTTLATPKTGVSYSASVAVVNVHGQKSEPQGASPLALQASDQLPGAPLHVLVDAMAHDELVAQWSPPADTGGQLVTSYRVEWDPSPAFNSRNDGTAKGVAIVPASSAAPVMDVQYVSVAVPLGKYLGGTFSLTFNGQATGELPYDVSAQRMQDALTALCTTGVVRTHIHAFMMSTIIRDKAQDSVLP